MGKQRVQQLLDQLKENQAKDIENAAAIYTVAQVAVNALNESTNESSAPQLSASALPTVASITKADLLERYGSFNDCRKAAKALGIKFSKTPSWDKLEAAFSYRVACHQLVQSYLAAYPNEHLNNVSLEIPLY
ncbi:MAG: hypothetical protein ACTS2F_12055 [Thainema sp.]